jgi:hypothetical protein
MSGLSILGWRMKQFIALTMAVLWMYKLIFTILTKKQRQKRKPILQSADLRTMLSHGKIHFYYIIFYFILLSLCYYDIICIFIINKRCPEQGSPHSTYLRICPVNPLMDVASKWKKANYVCLFLSWLEMSAPSNVLHTCFSTYLHPTLVKRKPNECM